MTEIQDQYETIDGRGGVYDVFVGKDLAWAEVGVVRSKADQRPPVRRASLGAGARPCNHAGGS